MALTELDPEDLRTDASRAESYRRRLGPLLLDLAAIMNEAKADGLVVSFQVAQDQYGRYVAPPVSVVKPL